MVISVLLLICVCARSDHRPNPSERERADGGRASERVWNWRQFDFQCYCVSAAVSLYPAALQPRLFISLALTGIVLKLAVKELIKQPLCLGWTNAPFYSLKLAVKSKSHCHQPNNTHTPARASRITRFPASWDYYSTGKRVFDLYNSAEKKILTLCCFTGRTSFSSNESGGLFILSERTKNKSIIKIHMRSHMTCTNQWSFLSVMWSFEWQNIFTQMRFESCGWGEDIKWTKLTQTITWLLAHEYLMQLLWCFFVLFAFFCFRSDNCT